MMATAAEFAESAESMVGVRWRKHGRSRIAGLDCGGLVVAALSEIGVPVVDSLSYDPLMPSPSFLARLFADNCVPAAFEDVGEGRIGLCSHKPGAAPRHLVVMLSGNRIVHVDASMRRVVVTTAGWMLGRLVSVFRIRDLEYSAPWQQS